MTKHFTECADLICDKLREVEHQAEEGDELFYCAYLLGLLGLHGNEDGYGMEAFDQLFSSILNDTLLSEGVDEKDQAAIVKLWNQVKEIG